MEGLEYVCGSSLLTFLSPEIANRRASSSAKVSWRAIKAVTKFDEYNLRSEERAKMQEWFWQMIKEMTDQER